MFQAAELNDNPQQHPRDRARLQPAPRAHRHRRRRGDGRVGAVRRPLRVPARYPEGTSFAHVTGYFTFTLGSSGVEKTYNDELAGRTFDLVVPGLGDLFVDKERVGNLTLSCATTSSVSRRDQLGHREGSVVALDPRTGEILTMVSFPMLQGMEGYLLRVPVFRTVYAPVKQLVLAFSPDNDTDSREWSWSATPPGGYALDFSPKSSTWRPERAAESLIAVYVPTNHLYLGDVVISRRDDAFFPDMTVEEGIRVFLTGGMTLPGKIDQNAP